MSDIFYRKRDPTGCLSCVVILGLGIITWFLLVCGGCVVLVNQQSYN